MIFLLLFALALSACANPAEALPLALPHLIFFTNAAVLYAIGRGATALAPPASRGLLWRLFRRTLPWHPLIAGACVGLLWPSMLPSAAGEGRPTAAMYFGASGVLACYGRDLFQTWIKYGHKPGAES